VILVQLRVDVRDLTLAEGIVERLVDHARAHAKPRGGGAIDRHRDFEAAVLLVAAHVAQLRHLAHRPHEPRRPRVQLLQVVALQRELVLRVGDPPAQADVLDRLQIERGPRDLRQLWPQARDHLVGRDAAL
jgi:hypothetical protein